MPEPILELLEKSFGIKRDIFEPMEFLRIGNDLYIMSKEVFTFRPMRVYRRGLRFAQIFSHSTKLATGAIQLFGKLAEKNTIQLSYAEAMMFAQGQEFSPYVKPTNSANGLVIAQYKQFPIGIGNYKDGRLKSLISRSQVIRIGVRKRKYKLKKEQNQ